MQFIAEQIIPEGYIVRFIVICGRKEDKNLIAVEGLYIKRTDEENFKMALPCVLKYANEGRLNDLSSSRARLIEKFDVDGEGIIMLPFITILKLRAEAWVKAEPFLQNLGL